MSGSPTARLLIRSQRKENPLSDTGSSCGSTGVVFSEGRGRGKPQGSFLNLHKRKFFANRK